jgi:hypothetical protein
MTDCAASGRQRIPVCVVCGAQFLPGSRRHATTCSAACLGWLRLKNKGRGEARARADHAADTPGHEQIAGKDRP